MTFLPKHQSKIQATFGNHSFTQEQSNPPRYRQVRLPSHLPPDVYTATRHSCHLPRKQKTHYEARKHLPHHHHLGTSPKSTFLRQCRLRNNLQHLRSNAHFFSALLSHQLTPHKLHLIPTHSVYGIVPYVCNSCASLYTKIKQISVNLCSKIWKFIYVLTILLSIGLTFICWYLNLLGLTIFGICGLTFIRQPSSSIYLPLSFSALLFCFLVFGIYTIFYFKKHMPNTIGLRKKKYQQNKILLYYIVGFSIYLFLYLIIDILQLVNCRTTSPNPQYLPLITLFNIIRITQFIFLATVVFRNGTFKNTIKKRFKRLFQKTQKSFADLKFDNTDKQSSFMNQEDDTINFQQFFLEIKQQKNQIDLLKMSQVITIVSGIYVAYKQYYNLHNDDQQLEQMSIFSDQYERSIFSQQLLEFSKVRRLKSVKKIYYHQKMSVVLDPQIIKDYVIDNRLLPKLGVLKCNLIIHAPKIFQFLLENDRLENIFQSFQIYDNSKKMFDLVEGQGGRSGQFFFFSHDNKYVLKTITQPQFLFIQQNLFYFHQHYRNNPQSVLAKIYGLFTFKGNQMQRTYHLILMKNILGCNKSQVLRTFDLKGSKYDRQVIREGDDMKVNQLQKITLKDVDFMKLQGRIRIKNSDKKVLREIIAKDSMFLKNLNLIDYSLLIVKVQWQKIQVVPEFWNHFQRIQSAFDQNIYYHVGVIDYLQRWDLQKKGQQWWKNLIGKRDISAQQPKIYQNRFINFIEEITQQFSFRDLQMGVLDYEKSRTQNSVPKEILRYDMKAFNQNYEKYLAFNRGITNKVSFYSDEMKKKIQREIQERQRQNYSEMNSGTEYNSSDPRDKRSMNLSQMSKNDESQPQKLSGQCQN